MSLLEDILLKINLKEIGRHIANYLDLYIRPIYAWRKTINFRNTSYDFLILHLFYYFVIVLLISSIKSSFNPVPIIGYVLFEALITIFPFTLLLIPFFIVTNAFNKKLNWRILFRNLLILKLQFLPLAIILLLLAKKTEYENLYIVLYNLMALLLIGFLIIIPTMIHIRWWQKIIWMILNYIFLIPPIMIISMSSTINQEKTEKKERLSAFYTPLDEYIEFGSKFNDTPQLIHDKYNFVLVKQDSNKLQFEENYPVTHSLFKYFITGFLKINSKNKTDSAYSDNYNHLILNAKTLSLKNLDSLQTSFSDAFDRDLRLAKFMIDSAQFESNRKYFTAINKYLSTLETANKVPENFDITFDQLLDDAKKGNIELYILPLGNDYFGTLYEVDTTNSFILKSNIVEMKQMIDKRNDYTLFLANLLFYPTEQVIEVAHLDYDK